MLTATTQYYLLSFNEQKILRYLSEAVFCDVLLLFNGVITFVKFYPFNFIYSKTVEIIIKNISVLFWNKTQQYKQQPITPSLIKVF